MRLKIPIESNEFDISSAKESSSAIQFHRLWVCVWRLRLNCNSQFDCKQRSPSLILFFIECQTLPLAIAIVLMWIRCQKDRRVEKNGEFHFDMFNLVFSFVYGALNKERVPSLEHLNRRKRFIELYPSADTNKSSVEL